MHQGLRWTDVAWIALGGAVGSAARYLFSWWTMRIMGAAFPYGTLGVNLLGSFTIAAVMELAAGSAGFSTSARLALTAGLLGGFTTYSAFAFETLRLIQQGAYGGAAGYHAITSLGCLLACALGSVGARWLIA
jgi:CrcB protein